MIPDYLLRANRELPGKPSPNAQQPPEETTGEREKSSLHLVPADCSPHEQRVALASQLTEILDEIEAVIREYIWRPEAWEYHTLTFFVCHTHTLDAFDWSPLLGLGSPDGGYGKTSTLLLLKGLTRNGLYREKLTVASAKRILDAGHKAGVPFTALFDQVRGHNADWEDLFDIGVRRGAVMTSSLKPKDGGDWKAFDYRVFGAKAVGYINGHDALCGTNISRAIILDYLEKGGERIARTYPQDGEAPEHVTQLRERIEAMVTPELLAVLRAHDTGLAPGRRNDTFRPLVTLGDCAGEPWRSRARDLLALDATKQVRMSKNLQALTDIVAVCEKLGDDDYIKSGDAALKMQLMEERPWLDEKLSAHRLTKYMQAWGVKSGKNPAGTIRGYRVGDLRRALLGQSEKKCQ
jgi:hypothetical protein